LKKNKFIIVILIIFIVAFISILTYIIDSQRLENHQTPIFILHTDNLNDGGTTVYYGIGYQLINWKRINPDNVNTVLVGIEKHFIIGIDIYVEKPKVELKETSIS